MRKLAIACSSFSIGIVAAHYFLPLQYLLPSAVILAIAALLLILGKQRIISAIIIFVAIGLVVYSVHYSRTVTKAELLSSDNISLEMLVVSEVNDYDTYSSARVKILSESYSGMVANLYDYNGLMPFLPGDVISAECKTSAANTRYGEQVDYNIARGVYVKATLRGESAQVIGYKYSAQVIGTLINSYFRDTAQKLFDGSERAFIIALMLGDKTELYSDTDTYVALSRTGFMHTVAVSGMHVAFVVAVISFLFGAGITGNIICLLIVWLFVIVTGASPSAVRAAFMQSVLISSKFFNRENDSITSLSFALACILLNNPFSISSVSLQLSFSAVLGMCLLADKIRSFAYVSTHEAKGFRRIRLKSLHYAAGILTASLSVMVFTVPLSIYYFGYVSLLSFVMNILCLWAIPLCFGGGYLAAFIFKLAPGLGTIIAIPVAFLAKFIIAAAKFVVRFKPAIIYFELPLMRWWLALVIVSIAVCAISNIKKPLKIILPLLIAALSLSVAKVGINSTFSNKFDSYNIIDVGQGQCIAAFSGDKTVLIDCGNQDEYFSNAGDTAASFLYSRERKQIDALYFTHLHSDHSNGFEHLASLIEIKKVIIPESSATDEFYEQLADICSAKNIPIEYNNSLETQNYGNMDVTVFPSGDYDAVNERCLKLAISDNGFDMLVTGDISANVERALIENFDLPQTEVIVAAHHGSRYSSCGDFLSAVSGQYAVISAGPNSYGHPTYETLERLSSYGYNIYRTDLNGTVSFYIRG